MTERWRLFVAVPIGERLRADLAAAVGVWRARPDLVALRWSDPRTWHVTLAFIGSTDPVVVPGIVDALERVAARHAPARRPTGGLGAFPAPGRARTAWYGIRDPDGALRALANDLRLALRIDEPAPFRPHLTLARARAGEVDLRSWIEDADVPSGALDVKGLELVRSHVGSGPPRHETLAVARIGASIGV